MKLTVVIVNYNVEYFLEQCLNSVFRALRNVTGEVYVVDNHSIDGSCAMVKQRFPQVKLIENKYNAGFSKANNQAIERANGEYVLLLNPDTVVEEDTFEKVIAFMDAHPEAGGLGVKMLDGKGNFLPESKRGLPTPVVAFYKVFGISKLFPRSRKFGRYHLSYLDKDETHEIEILSGAFMLMRKAALDKTGLLDEAFFMYGEDIDLSYRIILAGYKNYYYPHTRIIHYKGESTKKSSVNYVFVFYNAMIIFARKHFSEKNARTFSLLINLAIYLRASIAILNRFFKRIWVPLLDFALLLGGLILLTREYEKFKSTDFPEEVLYYALPGYALAWMGCVWLSGGYDKPIKPLQIVKGLLAGTALILIVYGLLPKDVQFSRVMIFAGSLWALLVYTVIRSLLHFTRIKGYSLTRPGNKRFVIVGKTDEADRVAGLLRQTNNYAAYIAYVNPEKSDEPGEYVGDRDQLHEIVDVLRIDEIIFCARDNSAQQIIDLMSKTDNRKTDFKIAQPESLYLIGSNSIDTSGDLYVLDINSITRPRNVRNKRLFDLTSSLLLLVCSPLLLLINPSLGQAIPVWISVFTGRKAMVGYSLSNPSAYRLPPIKKAWISTSSGLPESSRQEDVLRKIDIIYAKDYRIATDFRLVTQALFRKKKKA